MAAADIFSYPEIHDPNLEVVVLTCSSGETFDSKKFAAIDSVVGSYAEATGVTATSLIVAWSGRTVTVTSTGLTDKKVALVIVGSRK